MQGKAVTGRLFASRLNKYSPTVRLLKLKLLSVRGNNLYDSLFTSWKIGIEALSDSVEVFGTIPILRDNHSGSTVESVGMEDIGDRDGRDACLSGLENKNSYRFPAGALLIYGLLYLLLVIIKLERYFGQSLLMGNPETIVKVSLWVFLPVIKS